MSILYFTIIAFYFAIKSGWKNTKLRLKNISVCNAQMLLETRWLAGWLVGGEEIIVVISRYSDDLSLSRSEGQQAVDRLILAGQLSQ